MCWCSIPSEGKQRKRFLKKHHNFWWTKETHKKQLQGEFKPLEIIGFDSYGVIWTVLEIMALCLFLHLMELNCAWFFGAKRILSNIFQGNSRSFENMTNVFFSKNTSHNKAPIIRNFVWMLRVPDKRHWVSTQPPITPNLPLISWGLHSGILITPVTLMVRSPEADTIYLSSKSTTFTAARCPTRTRRRLMSVGEAMSQTAIDRSLEQVTIKPLAKRRWRTASLWWMSVLRTSPVVTSHTLGGGTGKRPLRQVKVWIKHEGCIEWWGQWRGVREEEAEEKEERQKRGDNGKVLWGTRKTVKRTRERAAPSRFTM